MADFDLAIIGGGINGTGLARDASGRGIKVLLVEMNDLGSARRRLQQADPWGLRYLGTAPFVLSARR
jgi:glycerol-3-phosphate dehydrogenase